MKRSYRLLAQGALLLIVGSGIFSAPHTHAQVFSVTRYTTIQEYEYTPLGNITTMGDDVYEYSPASLDFTNPHAPTSVGGKTHTYDKNGNLLSDGDSTYVWNTDNTLASVTKGNPSTGSEQVTTTYTYDATGQRTSLTTPTSTTLYPNKFYNVETTATGHTKTTKHIYAGSDLVATIETKDNTSTTFYHHPDHLGSSSVVTSGATTSTEPTTVQAHSYYPYGKVRVNEQAPSTGSGQATAQTTLFDEQKKFTGYEFDETTNLSYANARYYDQDRGQFISQDPAVLSLGTSQITQRLLADPQQQNAYSYARGNPMKYIDPDGEKVELVARPVFSAYDAHLFYLVTPDNPDEINITGIPSGTTAFTIGGYNRGGFFGIGNKLTPEFGYVGGPTNTDSPYLTGEKKPTASITIMTNEGQSDTELINSLGAAANSISPKSYFMLGNSSRIGNGNSNNYVYEVGSRAGIGNQVTAFNPSSVLIPGKNHGLPTSTLRQDIQSGIRYLGNQINSVSQKVVNDLIKK